jgi:hypothetical protein
VFFEGIVFFPLKYKDYWQEMQENMILINTKWQRLQTKQKELALTSVAVTISLLVNASLRKPPALSSDGSSAAVLLV